MIAIVRTNSNNKDFIELVELLDSYLSEMDGDEHSFYDQFNNIVNLNNVVLAYLDETAAGCGAFKEFSPGVIELKRMYTKPNFRGQKIGSKVLFELEKWAHELNYSKCILETGKRQVEAIEFYKMNGYSVMPNYGQYQNIEYSLCFTKNLI